MRTQATQLRYLSVVLVGSRMLPAFTYFRAWLRLTFAVLMFGTVVSAQIPSLAASTTTPTVSGNQLAESDLPNKPDGVLAQAKILLDRGRVSEAEQRARDYLHAHPASADGHALLGLILFKEVKPKDSLASYNQASRSRAPSPYDLEIVALDYALLEDYANADKWLTESLRLEPHSWEGWYYLGRTKYNENRFEEAIHAFDECLRLSPENVKAEDNLGLSYAGLGRYEEAAAAYRRAISWQSQLLQQNSGPYLDYGILLLEQNQEEQALGYLEQAAQIAPGDAKTHEHLGRAYQRLNQLAKAQSELEQAVKSKPDDAALHFVLGQVYRQQGLQDKAKVEFERCAMLNGTHSTTEKQDPTLPSTD